MLGEQIGEFRGKRVGMRVLPPEGGSPRMETTYQETGRLLGIDVVNSLTFVVTMGMGGVMHADGHIIVMARDGNGAMGRLTAIVRPTGKGTAGSVRGSVYFQTLSEKFARLNVVPGVFEAEEDENGNTQVRLWEWK